MLRYLKTLALLLPSSAFANPLCEPIGNIASQVNYCDENTAYVPHAKKCFQTFKALVDVENAKIKATLNKDLKNAKGTQQEADFQTTQAVLASSIATLANLLAQGKQTYNEIDAYSEDLVLPIYDAYPEDYNLNPQSAETQKIFREKECYGEPMEDLDGIKSELRNIITDLEKTKLKSESLHKISSFKDSNLDSVDPKNRPASQTLGKGSASTPTGKSKNGKSSITGVEESKKKNKKIP